MAQLRLNISNLIAKDYETSLVIIWENLVFETRAFKFSFKKGQGQAGAGGNRDPYATVPGPLLWGSPGGEDRGAVGCRPA